MNRLAPVSAPHPIRFSPRPYLPRQPLAVAAEPEADDPLADLKLFATGWLGGLVFFGTLFA